jgi:hypothetical protein
MSKPRIVGQGWEIEDTDLYKLEISLDSTPCCLSDVRLRNLLKNNSSSSRSGTGKELSQSYIPRHFHTERLLEPATANKVPVCGPLYLEGLPELSIVCNNVPQASSRKNLALIKLSLARSSRLDLSRTKNLLRLRIL